ncbi:hypothetical protein HanRHA438_Chr14g0679751 [Helianthus annuus]|nr:hypothetical protein HanRHA438_Chr14g0679751 [Helianthus annuus]
MGAGLARHRSPTPPPIGSARQVRLPPAGVAVPLSSLLTHTHLYIHTYIYIYNYI